VNLPLVGPKLGPRVRDVRAAVESGQLEPLPSGGYRAAGVELAPDEVFVSLKGKAGYEVAGDQDVLVALDTTVTPELQLEGRARELSRKINDLRKDAGFEIADRIHVRYEAGEGWSAVIRKYGGTICAETLALDFAPGLQTNGYQWQGDVDGERIALELQRSSPTAGAKRPRRVASGEGR